MYAVLSPHIWGMTSPVIHLQEATGKLPGQYRTGVSLHSHTLHSKESLNFIYQSDPGLPGGESFISVIDAVPGDGFNPIWEEVQSTFTDGNTPRQVYSDDEIEAAVDSGEITPTFTGEVYWCSVVGHKPLH